MRYGKLTVEERTDQREHGYCLWRCRCDCGGEILVSTKRLKNGTVTDCGCIPADSARRGRTAEDLTGRRFGKLTVIRRIKNKYNRTCWLCQCDCGNQCEVTAHMLKSGKVKSCGCLRGGKIYDITGLRFGRLTAIEPTERRDRKGSVYWRCHCDCGNETDAT